MGDKTKRHLPVALKPFNDPAMAVHELWGYSHILELGVHTYTPIGAFPAKEGDHYIFVTAKDDGLVSLDQTLWVPTSAICDEFSAEIAQKNISTVARIAELIAYLNINGIFLPDGQIKNFVENPFELIGAIDFEKATKVDIEHVDTFDMVWENVEKLIKSLVFKTDIKAINDTPGSEEPDKIFGVGMLHDMPTEQVRNFAVTVIINNYLNSLDENAISMDTENAYRYADFIRKRFLERLANDNSWPSHIVRAS